MSGKGKGGRAVKGKGKKGSGGKSRSAKVQQSTMGTVGDRMVKWLILVGHSALLRRCA